MLAALGGETYPVTKCSRWGPDQLDGKIDQEAGLSLVYRLSHQACVAKRRQLAYAVDGAGLTPALASSLRQRSGGRCPTGFETSRIDP